MEGYLVALSAIVAVSHVALGPDHYVPFIGLGRAQQWSNSKLFSIIFLGGLLHVGSSFLIGSIGLLAGFALTQLEGVEEWRASVAPFLLIGFGIAYAIWGLKRSRHDAYTHLKIGDASVWMLILIFVFGPCEPMIPIMFLAAIYGLPEVIFVSATFGIVTVATMLTISFALFHGVSLLPMEKLEHHTHTLAGAVIAATGLAVVVFGL
jgi:hypothetical protein